MNQDKYFNILSFYMSLKIVNSKLKVTPKRVEIYKISLAT